MLGLGLGLHHRASHDWLCHGTTRQGCSGLAPLGSRQGDASSGQKPFCKHLARLGTQHLLAQRLELLALLGSRQGDASAGQKPFCKHLAGSSAQYLLAQRFQLLALLGSCQGDASAGNESLGKDFPWSRAGNLLGNTADLLDSLAHGLGLLERMGCDASAGNESLGKDLPWSGAHHLLDGLGSLLDCLLDLFEGAPTDDGCAVRIPADNHRHFEVIARDVDIIARDFDVMPSKLPTCISEISKLLLGWYGVSRNNSLDSKWAFRLWQRV